jgi:hypothetical protein
MDKAIAEGWGDRDGDAMSSAAENLRAKGYADAGFGDEPRTSAPPRPPAAARQSTTSTTTSPSKHEAGHAGQRGAVLPVSRACANRPDVGASGRRLPRNGEEKDQ